MNKKILLALLPITLLISCKGSESSSSASSSSSSSEIHSSVISSSSVATSSEDLEAPYKVSLEKMKELLDFSKLTSIKFKEIDNSVIISDGCQSECTDIEISTIKDSFEYFTSESNSKSFTTKELFRLQCERDGVTYTDTLFNDFLDSLEEDYGQGIKTENDKYTYFESQTFNCYYAQQIEGINTFETLYKMKSDNKTPDKTVIADTNRSIKESLRLVDSESINFNHFTYDPTVHGYKFYEDSFYGFFKDVGLEGNDDNILKELYVFFEDEVLKSYRCQIECNDYKFTVSNYTFEIVFESFNVEHLPLPDFSSFSSCNHENVLHNDNYSDEACCDLCMECYHPVPGTLKAHDYDETTHCCKHCGRKNYIVESFFTKQIFGKDYVGVGFNKDPITNKYYNHVIGDSSTEQTSDVKYIILPDSEELVEIDETDYDIDHYYGCGNIGVFSVSHYDGSETVYDYYFAKTYKILSCTVKDEKVNCIIIDSYFHEPISAYNL